MGSRKSSTKRWSGSKRAYVKSVFAHQKTDHLWSITITRQDGFVVCSVPGHVIADFLEEALNPRGCIVEQLSI